MGANLLDAKKKAVPTSGLGFLVSKDIFGVGAMGHNGLVFAFSFGYGDSGETHVTSYFADVALNCQDVAQLCRTHVAYMYVGA